MWSEVQISNYALAALGQPSISAMDDDTPLARQCRNLYPKARQHVLASAPWASCIMREKLAESPNTPVYGFAKAFILPADRLAVLEVITLGRYQIEGGYILTDADAVNMRYLKDERDTSKFSTLLVFAIADRLAASLAMPIMQDASKAAYYDAVARSSFNEALRYESLAKQPTPLQESGVELSRLTTNGGI